MKPSSVLLLPLTPAQAVALRLWLDSGVGVSVPPPEKVSLAIVQQRLALLTEGQRLCYDLCCGEPAIRRCGECGVLFCAWHACLHPAGGLQ